MTELTQKYLKELFDYHNGNLYWKVSKTNSIKIGDKAGYLDKSTEYYRIRINSKNYRTHRLIFLYHKGYLPKIIDHIDNNSTNNNIENLREVTLSQNGMNRKSYKNTSSIYKGISWNKRDKIWITQIQINGKLKHLGSFKSERAAAFIYNVYARGYFGEFACLNDLKE